MKNADSVSPPQENPEMICLAISKITLLSIFKRSLYFKTAAVKTIANLEHLSNKKVVCMLVCFWEVLESCKLLHLKVENKKKFKMPICSNGKSNNFSFLFATLNMEVGCFCIV